MPGIGKFVGKKEVAATLAIMIFFAIGYSFLHSIYAIRDNTRVVKQVAFIRGSTQKLVKEELMGVSNDALITRLDAIILDLLDDGGPGELILLPDTVYVENMFEIRAHWEQLKREIYRAREGQDREALFQSSEEFFELANLAITSAETFSEAKIARTLRVQTALIAGSLFATVAGGAYFVRTRAITRKAADLGKIAFVDPLTRIQNRASCERTIERLRKTPPEGDLAVLMFDMNNLKVANDQLGHQVGDRMIADFARILAAEASPFGFVGRYGGDEFIAIFEHAGEGVVHTYLDLVKQRIDNYNIACRESLEKLSYSVGHSIRPPQTADIDDMIYEADIGMYEMKRAIKENRAGFAQKGLTGKKRAL
jgi:diguanylate cyclase (GGDEF) domain